MARNEMVVKGQAPRGGAWLLAALLLLVGVFLLARGRVSPPEPRGADAPAGEFSAARARGYLDQIVGDGSSRWLASEANARAREHIVDALSQAGYEPQVQRAVACRPWGACAAVANVVARREGREAGPDVLVLAHYDSVKAGPGAADDASGVAAMLETARLLAKDPAPRNTTIFLATDGEEAGLFGAAAFAEHHPWAAELGAVINLESRGSGGPSLMFETGPGTGALLRHYARSSPRPVTSSLFVTIYERLPNDTDFTIFRRRGIPGFNFAFVGDAATYHTSRDTLENLDLGSLQHHGDQLLPLLRELGQADLTPRSVGPPVFFDLFAAKVFGWPASWTVGFAALVLLLVLGAAVAAVRRRLASGGGIGRGVLVWLAMVVGGAALAFLVGMALRAAGAVPPPWAAFASHPPLLSSFLLAALLGGALAGTLLARGASFWGLFAGTWLLWAAAGVALALAVPGGSFLFLVPALFAGLLGLAGALRGSEGLGRAAALVGAVAAASLWVPLALLLYDGLGNPGLAIVAGLLAVCLTALGPFFGDAAGRARWAVPGAAAVALLVAVVGAFVSPPRLFPPGERLILFQEEGNPARWVVPSRGRPAAPPRLSQAQPPFGGEPAAGLPWWVPDERAFVAPAAAASLGPPELVIASQPVDGDRRTVRGRIVSPRGASEIALHLPASLPLVSASFGGEEVPSRDGELGQWRGPWRSFSFYGLGAEGVEIELVVDSAEPFEAYLADESNGPPAGVDSPLPAPAAGERRAPDRVSTVLARRLRLGAATEEPAAPPAP